jgi:aerobic carbon-monoxide dehydrogenase medium subunit
VKSAPFEYHAPTTLSDAVGLLGELGDEAKPLAGGQSLLPLLAMRLTRFEHLIDIGAVAELQGIDRVNGHVRVGAAVRQSTAEHDATVVAEVPLLARALPHIGHFQIRNRGTVGGSTAHADPCSELPAVALALDAELEIGGASGTRVVEAADFFEGTWTTALAPDEVLVAIRYPVWAGRAGFAIRELARRPGDFAIAGAACGVSVASDGRVDRAAISMFGMGPTPLRARVAEAALVGHDAAHHDLDAIASAAVADTDPLDDIHAPAWYRRRIGSRLVTLALTDALEEAAGGDA